MKLTRQSLGCKLQLQFAANEQFMSIANQCAEDFYLLWLTYRWHFYNPEANANAEAGPAPNTMAKKLANPAKISQLGLALQLPMATKTKAQRHRQSARKLGLGWVGFGLGGVGKWALRQKEKQIK